MHIDTDADDGKGQHVAFGLGLDQDPARLATAEQQIVGPAQIDTRARWQNGLRRPRPDLRLTAEAANEPAEMAERSNTLT